ncbi:MAG TPA: hypothetical protein VGG72_23260 [Bryobacteraceae bacterium]|jgi:hypothetical protein
MMSPAATEYIRELAARKSKAYELLLALDENPQADESCFQSLAQIVDRIQFFEISLDGGALEGLRGLVKSESKELEATLAVLALAFSEAELGRKSIHLLLEGYPKWLRAASEAVRPHLLGILPNIAIHLEEMEASGVDAMIACLNACGNAEDCEIVAGCVDRYRETSGKILSAAVEIAGIAIRAHRRPLVEQLMLAVTPEAMLDSKPARELLPALAKLGSAPAIAVCVAVATHNHSSALNLARHLNGPLASMPAEMQLAYLSSFEQIVEEAGVSLVGYGIKQLPLLFQKAGEERATEFVAQGVTIARRYGKIAAEEFFEQKTAAAKSFG